MKQKIYIEWSEVFDNDIMGLARSKSDFLKLNNCIYSYISIPENSNTFSDFPKLMYADFLFGNIYYSSVKDKLIENLGRSEIQEINNSSNWNLSIIIGKVLTGDGEILTGQLMKSVCDQLTEEYNAECSDEGPQENHRNFEFVHIFDNMTNGFLSQQEAV